MNTSKKLCSVISIYACKLLCIMFLIFGITTTAHATEVSIGASMGPTIAFLRGSHSKYFVSHAEFKTGDEVPSRVSFQGRPVDVMIEFLPYLGMEFGLGIGASVMSYKESDVVIKGTCDASSSIRVDIERVEFYMPLMLRAQYEYKVGVTYISAGFKFCVPMIDYMYQYDENLKTAATVITESSSVVVKSSSFVVDASFAIGQEFRLGYSNYLGIRVGYDLNITPAYRDNLLLSSTREITDSYMDNLNIALTYRYAFNSKWR